MCGIIGCTGVKPALTILLEGLGDLEYRGYDSSGVALLGEGIHITKRVGQVQYLREAFAHTERQETTGIGHTRWATHGAPSRENAHPHTDKNRTVAVVHNGIIENYLLIQEELKQKNIQPDTDTDTEVIPHLLAYYRREGMDPFSAIRTLVEKLSGSYALGIVFSDRPNRVYAIRKGSPLWLARQECMGMSLLASDPVALRRYGGEIYALEEGEIACLSPACVSVFDRQGVYRKIAPLPDMASVERVDKGGYPTFMEKEIHQVPISISQTMVAPRDPLPTGASRVYLVGCGSAYHAALVGEILIERYLGIPAIAMIASEFRYRDVPLSPQTPVIFLSQSGETADTLASLREAKKKGAPTYAIVNVQESSIGREADLLYHTKAGVEVAVATTKAYCAQLTALYSLIVGEVPTKVVTACQAAMEVDLQDLVPYWTARAHGFYIGRGMDGAICREGSLKLKEISYLHAEAYDAGELKHGTISLIEEGTPVIGVITESRLAAKTLANLEEVRARGGKIWLIAGHTISTKGVAYPIIRLPEIEEVYAPLPCAVLLEHLALRITLSRGYNPDRPRNLAKSVTVE